MNKWIGIGRLTKDGELAYIPGTGTPVMKFTLAVDNYRLNINNDYEKNIFNGCRCCSIFIKHYGTKQ